MLPFTAVIAAPAAGGGASSGRPLYTAVLPAAVASAPARVSVLCRSNHLSFGLLLSLHKGQLLGGAISD
jgi:hypothetical protein